MRGANNLGGSHIPLISVKLKTQKKFNKDQKDWSFFLSREQKICSIFFCCNMLLYPFK